VDDVDRGGWIGPRQHGPDQLEIATWCGVGKTALQRDLTALGGAVPPAMLYGPVMNAIPQRRMSVDEYLAWADGLPGRYELIDGIIHAMSPERIIHGERKLAIHVALLASVRLRGLPCHVLPDGNTVRIDQFTSHEPDALVYCGAKLPPASLEVPNPILVVEVMSLSSQNIDGVIKLANYFRLESIVHYLIVDPEQPLVIHHARQPDDTILTRIIREGVITLSPLGIEIAVADIYGATPGN
jgi:Uma2 family endonuclease